jgi:uncharacterized membrane protein YidH (DUF202 family)
MLIGGAILFKVNHDQANNSDTTFENKKPYLITFGILIIISGIISFMLEKNFFTKFKPFQKIPYYMMIAICLNFCMVFSIVDIVNYVFGYF